MSSSLSCERSPLYHGAWIKDFIILNLILFSWLVSMRGGKIEKGEVCLVIQLLRMQIIKSCRCGDHYGAKSYVFASNLKDKLVVLVEGMSNDYVILSRKKIALSCFSQDCSFFHHTSYFILTDASDVSPSSLPSPLHNFMFVACWYLQLVFLVVCELTIYFVFSQNIWISSGLWCLFFLAFLYFYHTRSKNLRVVTFFSP